jgi:transmembrane sensor
MNNIHLLPDRSDIEQQAAAWIARLHADDVSPEDRARFESWRTAHSLHADAYQHMAAAIDEVKRAGHIVRAVSFGNEMNNVSRSPRRLAPRARRRLAATAAAAGVAVVASALAWWSSVTSHPNFRTAVGEHASIDLPDGSHLELNSQSDARVSYDRRTRIIYLIRGEAYFKVAQDPMRPFWVIADHSWVRALGTAFNVDLRASGVRVTVNEGVVKVGPAHGRDSAPTDAALSQAPASILTAGQQAELVHDSTQIRAAAPEELTRLSAWRRGKLYFENAPLESVVEELGRYTQERIVIEGTDLRSVPVGGTFQANPQGVEALLGMLRDGLDVTVRKSADGSIHIAREPGKH